MKYFRSLSAALLAVVPPTALAQTTYPHELLPQTDFTVAGQGEDGAGYSLTVSYTVVQNSEAHESYGVRDATVLFQTTLTVPTALADWSFYSAFVQLGAPGSDPMSMLDDQYFEGYTCTVRHLDADEGRVDEANAFRYTTCGTTELSTVETGDYLKFLGVTEPCSADYTLDFDRSATATGAGQSTVQCAFSRDFLVPGLFAIRPAEPMVFRAGFNVYPSAVASRSAWGYSDSLELAVSTPVEAIEESGAGDCACLARSLSVAASAVAALALLLDF